MSDYRAGVIKENAASTYDLFLLVLSYESFCAKVCERIWMIICVLGIGSRIEGVNKSFQICVLEPKGEVGTGGGLSEARERNLFRGPEPHRTDETPRVGASPAAGPHITDKLATH